MEFSEKIRKARTAKGLSQRELAEASGVSLRTIQNYELGTRMPKKKDTYLALANALDINEEVLLDRNASHALFQYLLWGYPSVSYEGKEILL